jgi:pimeloyl-ACP methyl ester carboxylesterase
MHLRCRKQKQSGSGGRADVDRRQSGEATISYYDRGNGPAVVLVHGHPFDHSMWHPQATFLAARGYRVIAPDLRGYGQSTVHPGVCTLEVLADDIIGLLDQLGVAAAAFCGLSMGGQIVLDLVRRYPGRVQAIVLADTCAQAETADGVRMRHATADRLLAEGLGGYAGEALPKMISPTTIRQRPHVAAHVLRMMRETDPAGAAAALRGRAARPDYVPVLGRIGVPALVLVGAEDEYTPITDAQLLATGIPGATLTIVERAAHLPNLEQPELVNAALGQFLDSALTASGPARMTA